MVCRTLKLPDGSTAIVCGPRRPPRRCACGQPAALLCDWKVPGKKSGTCDRPLCRACATKVGPDKDLCPEHTARHADWRARKGAPS